MDFRSLSMSGVARVDAICDAFEAAWRGGRRLRIEQFLAAAEGSERGRLLRALLALELELFWQAGERATPDQYHARFPSHAAVIDAVFSEAEAGETGAGMGLEPELGAAAPSPVPLDFDAEFTLTYSVGRAAGRIEPLVAPEGRRRLEAAFAPGGLIHGRYRIERELGRGGMGVVFLGRDLRLDRPVAIKACLLQGQTCDQDEARSSMLRGAFVEEARIGANLSHPAIATVHDFGFHDDKPYTVFEYLPGETLRDAAPASEAAACWRRFG